MAPSKRSRGAPTSSRVYSSTPSLQQARFPGRKRTVQTYGRRNLKSRELRQQTLTQIDFVSSFEEEEDNIVSSETEEEEENDDKENPTKEKDDDTEEVEHDENDEGIEEEEAPVSSGRKRRAVLKEKRSENRTSNKRRRTLGDETDAEPATKKKESRRKTLGDPPTSSYHTQTLTQFLEKDNLIEDSEDDGDDGFDNWLQEPKSPQQRQEVPESLPAMDQILEETVTQREGSIIPQTPAKRKTRAVIPSSSQLSTPLSSYQLSRYGPADQIYESPSARATQPSHQQLEPLHELPGKPKSSTPKKSLVIEDSFATGSWGSSRATPMKRTPLKDVTSQAGGAASQAPSRESSSAPDTPTRPPRRGPLGERSQLSPTLRRSKTPTPRKRFSPLKSIAGRHEIPDSDEDSEFWGEDEIDQENQAPDGEEKPTADVEDENESAAGPVERESPSPASNNDKQQYTENSTEAQATKTTSVIEDSTDDEDDANYAVGPDTLFVIDEVETSFNNTSEIDPLLSRREESSCTPKTTQPVPTPREPLSSKPLREPIQHSLPSYTQTQPLESQRVPLSVIRGLGEPEYATDILLPVSPSIVNRLVSGHLIHIDLSFKIFPQVTRFWLYDGSWLQYLACAKPGIEQGASLWRHDVGQVYELNNPCDEEDMTEEEWYQPPIGRYKHLPPAVVSRLLSNLKHGLFEIEDEVELPTIQQNDPSSDPPQPNDQTTPKAQASKNTAPPSSLPGNISISQQVEAQIRSESDHFTQHPVSEDTILVPSTPTSHQKKTLRDPLPPPPPPPGAFVRPSQATTASQASTPDKSLRRSQRRQQQQQQPPLPQDSHQTSSSLQRNNASSSSHLTFQDYGSSSPPFILPQSHHASNASDLLTKSQMIPDSLLRDESQIPPEIWSTDDEES